MSDAALEEKYQQLQKGLKKIERSQDRIEALEKELKEWRDGKAQERYGLLDMPLEYSPEISIFRDSVMDKIQFWIKKEKEHILDLKERVLR